MQLLQNDTWLEQPRCGRRTPEINSHCFPNSKGSALAEISSLAVAKRAIICSGALGPWVVGSWQGLNLESLDVQTWHEFKTALAFMTRSETTTVEVPVLLSLLEKYSH